MSSQNCTLFITIYGKREQTKPLDEQMESLVDQLRADLLLTPLQNNLWKDQNKTIFLYRFYPPQAGDTTVVQLVLNDSSGLPQAWDKMRRKAEAVLKESLLQKPVRGYTLVYRAELPGTVPDEPSDDLLSAARPLGASSSDPQTSAQSDMSHGRLWLLRIPTEGEGYKAGMVYIALSPAGAATQMEEVVLFGPTATLLMPDLIAHKGYHQMRQYRLGDIPENYQVKVQSMVENAGRLLSGLQADDLGLESEVANQIGNLPQDYGNVAGIVVTNFAELRTSLQKQLYNYDQWRNPDRDIFNLHRRHIQLATDELNLLLNQGQNALNVVSTAIQALEVEAKTEENRLEKKRQRQQNRLEVILMIIAVVLAAPQWITPDVTKSLTSQVANSLNLSAASCNANVLCVAGEQVAITVLVGIVVYLIWRFYSK